MSQTAEPEVADPVALSQDHEYRIRALENAVTILLYRQAVPVGKGADAKAEALQETADAAAPIAFSMGNYPVDVE